MYGGPAAADTTVLPRQAFAIDPGRRAAWLKRWRRNILAEARNRYCDSAMGEEIGWLISPLLEGFYYGHVVTGDAGWIERLIDWTDAWVRRGVVEPDGYVGWPKVGAAGTDVDNLDSFYADSLLGEAMVLRPVVLAAAAILKDPALDGRYGQTCPRLLASRARHVREMGPARRLAQCRRRHDLGGSALWHRPDDRAMDGGGA